MIAFTCAGCGKSLKVKDDFAGKRGACPHCKKPVLVPALEATIDASQEGDTPSSEEVDGAKLDFLAPARKPGELGWLGRYRVLKVLGAGGMGMVLQAEDPLLKRAIAVACNDPKTKPEVKLWDVANQKELDGIKDLANRALGLSFSPDGKFLLVASQGAAKAKAATRSFSIP